MFMEEPSQKKLKLGDESGQDGGVAEASVVDAETRLEDSVPERYIELVFTWSSKPFTLSIAEVFDLKASLQSLTNVPPERQKIIGLVKGKLPADDVCVQSISGDLRLAPGKKFTLIGTPQGDEIKDPSQLEFLPDVLNDLDIDFSAAPEAAAAYLHDQRNKRKIREISAKLQVNIIHPLREGKKLLVLDIDYSKDVFVLSQFAPGTRAEATTAILDTKPLTSGALPPQECVRPRLHEFLEAVYPHYDICIWSQTSWVWLETKLVEVGMLGTERNYKISFVLDKTTMFSVFSTRNGQPYRHHVKPLQIIWNRFPQYSAKNTIHVDDLARNFALNPRQGLKISAFKDAHTPRAMSDRELDKLAIYMVHIADLDDLNKVQHKDWKNVVRGLRPDFDAPST
ncbi:HAD IIID h [Gloeophyllum trabeum ATCC 11539]|uniref:HAD IIID h n=1 Tax=Gloeophyllum trabeum (strain ATCC 11539 / FP-39264 / Madison 617) TaxID=670483 RepID=S7QF23_GLOTA|nr:HAD IIID h [Gloeophyllum trabeum ATCC 11539]EPQ57908.1 HAD IIID h [Gloeophyllum trabeum ATCC 11539]